MLQGVYRVLVADRRVVEALSLPNGIVLAADRRVLGVVYGALGMTVDPARHVELLDPFYIPGRPPLLTVYDDERGEAHDKGQNDQTDNDPGPGEHPARALIQLGTSL